MGVTLQSTAGAATTIIDGGGSGDVVRIIASDVTINGFTIQNSGDSAGDAGIEITNTIRDCTIENCIITGNENGIYLDRTKGCDIQYNEIMDNSDKGVYLENCDGSNNPANDANVIFDNEIYEEDGNQQNYGIYLENSDYQNIQDNVDNLGIHDHSEYGIYLTEYSDYNLIEGNIIEANPIGMTLFLSDNNEIRENMIRNNINHGIVIASTCWGNKIYHNDFIVNNGADTLYDINHIQALDGSTNNDWYDTAISEGNHWSDLTHPDDDEDEIVDDPYLLEENDEDPFPLIVPYGVL